MLVGICKPRIFGERDCKSPTLCFRIANPKERSEQKLSIINYQFLHHSTPCLPIYPTRPRLQRGCHSKAFATQVKNYTSLVPVCNLSLTQIFMLSIYCIIQLRQLIFYILSILFLTPARRLVCDLNALLI